MSTSKRFTIKKGLLSKKRCFLKICLDRRENANHINQPKNFSKVEQDREKLSKN